MLNKNFTNIILNHLLCTHCFSQPGSISLTLTFICGLCFFVLQIL